MSIHSRHEPELPLLPFDLYELNTRTRRDLFPDLQGDGEIVIAACPTLASITLAEPTARIEIHSLFNLEWLPIRVMEHILIHEHIHRVIRPREVEPGVWKQHPPEFWEMEIALSPFRYAVWEWIRFEWEEVIRRDEKAECIWVKRGWRKRLADRRKGYQEWAGADWSAYSIERFSQWQEAVERARLEPTDAAML